MENQTVEIEETTLEEIINAAVSKAVSAKRVADDRQPKDAFSATEKRLYAYPIIKLKIVSDRERIAEIEQNGAPYRSKVVIGLQKFGTRLTSEQIADVLIHDINSQIAENEYEIETIDKALATIAGDPYENIIRLKYFEGKSGEEISALLSRDQTTIWRQRSRLVGRIAVFLYGVAAVI